MEPNDPANAETSQMDRAGISRRHAPAADVRMMVSTKASKKLYSQSAAGYYQMSSDTADEGEMVQNASNQAPGGHVHTFTESTENDSTLTFDPAAIAEYCEISMESSMADQNVYVNQPSSDQNVYVNQPSSDQNVYVNQPSSDQNVYVSQPSSDQNVYVDQLSSDQNVYVNQPSTEYQPYCGQSLQTFPDGSERDLAGYVYYEVSTSDLQALTQNDDGSAPRIATQQSVENPFIAGQLQSCQSQKHANEGNEYVFESSPASALQTPSDATQQNEAFTQYYYLPATEGLQTSVFTYTSVQNELTQAATTTVSRPTAHEYQMSASRLPTTGDLQISDRRLPTTGDLQITASRLPTTGDLQMSASRLPTTGDLQMSASRLPTTGDLQMSASRLPTTGDLQITASRLPTTGDLQMSASRLPTTGDLQITASCLPTTGDLQMSASRLPTTGDLQITASCLPTTGDLQMSASRLPTTGDLQITASCLPTTGDLQISASRLPTTGDLQMSASRLPTTGDLQMSASRLPTTGDLQITADSQLTEAAQRMVKRPLTPGELQTLSGETVTDTPLMKLDCLPTVRDLPRTTHPSNESRPLTDCSFSAHELETMARAAEALKPSVKMEYLPTTSASSHGEDQINATQPLANSSFSETVADGTQVTSIKMECVPPAREPRTFTSDHNQMRTLIEATTGEQQARTDAGEVDVPAAKCEFLATAGDSVSDEGNTPNPPATGGPQTMRPQTMTVESVADLPLIKLENAPSSGGGQRSVRSGEKAEPQVTEVGIQTVSDGTAAPSPEIKMECLPTARDPQTSADTSTNRNIPKTEVIIESAEENGTLMKLECLPSPGGFPAQTERSAGETSLAKLECLPGEVQTLPCGDENKTSQVNDDSAVTAGEQQTLTHTTGDMPLVKMECLPPAKDHLTAPRCGENEAIQLAAANTSSTADEPMPKVDNLTYSASQPASADDHPKKQLTSAVEVTPALESPPGDVHALTNTDSEEETPMPVLERMPLIKLETSSASGGPQTSNSSSFTCQVQGKVSEEKLARNRKTRSDSRSLFTELLALQQQTSGKKKTQRQQKDLINIVSFEPGVELDSGSSLSIRVKNGSGKTQTYHYEVKEAAYDAGVGTATVVRQETASCKDQRKRRNPRKSSAPDTAVVGSEMEDVSDSDRVASLKMEVEDGEESLSEQEIQEAITEEEMDTNDEDDLWENWQDHDPDYDVTKEEDDESTGSDEAADSKPDVHIVKGSLRPSSSAILPRRRNSEAGSAECFEVKCTGKDMKDGLICRYTFCDETFQKWCQLTNHERSHNGLAALPCKHCKPSTSDPQNALHSAVLTCHCGKEFKEVKRLTDHAKVHDESRPHRCEYCNKRFKTKTVLARHVRTHTGEVKYECMYCGRGFGDYSSWKRHERVHTGETPYKCEHCEQQFKQSKNLKAHVNAAHTGLEHYACETCGKTFLRKDILYSHRKSHEPKSTERPFQCEIEGCGKYYRTKKLLGDHKLIHTGIKQYKCDFCDKTFLKSGARTVHHRTHTNERPFKCDICDDAFRTKGALLQHRNIHTGSRPHKCRFCDQAFAAKSSVYNHEKMHKKELEGLAKKELKSGAVKGSLDTPVQKRDLPSRVRKPLFNVGERMAKKRKTDDKPLVDTDERKPAVNPYVFDD